MSLRQSLLTYFRVPHLRRGVLIALTGAGVAYLGYGQSLATARAEYDAARGQMVAAAAEQAAFEAREALSERYLSLSARIDVLDQKLAAGADRSGLVERLTGLAAETETRIIHGANSFGTERGGITPLLQDLTIEGSYAQVRAFLAGVRAMETLTMLVSIELSANADGTLVRAAMQFMTLSDVRS